MNEVIITSDIERLRQAYDTLQDQPTAQTGDDVKLSLENVSPTDIPQLEENLMSLPELTPHRVIKLPKSNVFHKNILQQIACSKYENYFQDAMGILHKKVLDFNTVFSAVLLFSVVPQYFIKYLLHTSHDSLEQVGAMKLYHFLK